VLPTIEGREIWLRRITKLDDEQQRILEHFLQHPASRLTLASNKTFLLLTRSQIPSNHQILALSS
jgi:hypothetical protein